MTRIRPLVLILLNLIFLCGVCMAGQDQPNVRLIAIDPGFGGHETGPSGCQPTVPAKHINLQIAKKLAQRIKTDLSLDTILTRTDDTNTPLEDRTRRVNSSQADLLISIHVNGSEDPRASGIETFYLAFEPAPGSLAFSVNDPEPSADLSDKETIIRSVIKKHTERMNDSKRLAENVNQSLCSHLKHHRNDIKNRGVKCAPFYILLGARMSAILVQPGFLTHPDECVFLHQEGYQEEICRGIVQGLKQYMNDNSSGGDTDDK